MGNLPSNIFSSPPSMDGRVQPSVNYHRMTAAYADDQAMRSGALMQVDRLCERQLLWDTKAQAEPRSMAIDFLFVVTAADLSGDSELQPAKLDDGPSIL